MKLKKITCIALMASVALGISACGKNDSVKDGTGSKSDSQVESSAQNGKNGDENSSSTKETGKKGTSQYKVNAEDSREIKIELANANDIHCNTKEPITKEKLVSWEWLDKNALEDYLKSYPVPEFYFGLVDYEEDWAEEVESGRKPAVFVVEKDSDFTPSYSDCVADAFQIETSVDKMKDVSMKDFKYYKEWQELFDAKGEGEYEARVYVYFNGQYVLHSVYPFTVTDVSGK